MFYVRLAVDINWLYKIFFFHTDAFVYSMCVCFCCDTQLCLCNGFLCRSPAHTGRVGCVMSASAVFCCPTHPKHHCPFGLSPLSHTCSQSCNPLVERKIKKKKTEHFIPVHTYEVIEFSYQGWILACIKQGSVQLLLLCLIFLLYGCLPAF